jgi:hypothetical protein
MPYSIKGNLPVVLAHQTLSWEKEAWLSRMKKKHHTIRRMLQIYEKGRPAFIVGGLSPGTCNVPDIR